MHPLMLQQLAADHVSYMITQAEVRRLARRARLARRLRTSRQQTGPVLTRMQAQTKRPSPNTAVRRPSHQHAPAFG
jgi:hypothetical protein